MGTILPSMPSSGITLLLPSGYVLLLLLIFFTLTYYSAGIVLQLLRKVSISQSSRAMLKMVLPSGGRLSREQLHHMARNFCFLWTINISGVEGKYLTGGDVGHISSPKQLSVCCFNLFQLCWDKTAAMFDSILNQLGISRVRDLKGLAEALPKQDFQWENTNTITMVKFWKLWKASKNESRWLFLNKVKSWSWKSSKTWTLNVTRCLGKQKWEENVFVMGLMYYFQVRCNY